MPGEELVYVSTSLLRTAMLLRWPLSTPLEPDHALPGADPAHIVARSFWRTTSGCAWDQRTGRQALTKSEEASQHAGRLRLCRGAVLPCYSAGEISSQVTGLMGFATRGCRPMLKAGAISFSSFSTGFGPTTALTTLLLFKQRTYQW